MPTSSVLVCCECTPVCDVEFGEMTGRAPSEAVVEAVAALEGVEPTTLETLYDHINPEALDHLFADSSGATVPTKLCTFTYCGWNVFVRGDGTVRVCDPDRTTDPEPVFEKSIAD